MQTASSVPSNSRIPLPSLLSTNGKNYHLPHISLPRQFRLKSIPDGTKVHIAKHEGTINKELGRGSYGVVVQIDRRRRSVASEHNTLALKTQSPIDCLAWECEILRKIDRRLRDNVDESCFPEGFTFLSLADGALLSMSAGSETGLNLVDLVNVYKKVLGELVPEIVALHYVSRLLRHLEQLHWHGKILHCDVKPDNVVMCNLECDDNIVGDAEFAVGGHAC